MRHDTCSLNVVNTSRYCSAPSYFPRRLDFFDALPTSSSEGIIRQSVSDVFSGMNLSMQAFNAAPTPIKEEQVHPSLLYPVPPSISLFITFFQLPQFNMSSCFNYSGLKLPACHPGTFSQPGTCFVSRSVPPTSISVPGPAPLPVQTTPRCSSEFVHSFRIAVYG